MRSPFLKIGWQTQRAGKDLGLVTPGHALGLSRPVVADPRWVGRSADTPWSNTRPAVAAGGYGPRMPTMRRTRPSRSERYRPNIGTADAALLKEPLTAAQQEHLRAWLRTTAPTGLFDALVDDDYAIPVNAIAWREQLGAAPSILEVVSDTGYVSRGDVRRVAADCARTEAWTPLLVASYAWGQGRNGYGPRRLSDIRAGATAAGRDLDKTLGVAVSAMRARTAVDGYASLVGAIRGLGPAFFTKFLYFAGTQVRPATGPAPLILDAVVAGQVRQVATARAVADSAIAEPEGLCAWLWSTAGWSPRRYGVWLDFAQAATAELADSGGPDRVWPARTDMFELAVFKEQLNP